LFYPIWPHSSRATPWRRPTIKMAFFPKAPQGDSEFPLSIFSGFRRPSRLALRLLPTPPLTRFSERSAPLFFLNRPFHFWVFSMHVPSSRFWFGTVLEFFSFGGGETLSHAFPFWVCSRFYRVLSGIFPLGSYGSWTLFPPVL